jgi:hypothetical protein
MNELGPSKFFSSKQSGLNYVGKLPLHFRKVEQPGDEDEAENEATLNYQYQIGSGLS